MTPEEIAIEFAQIFEDLPAEQINEMLAKNIPLETIQFFSQSLSKLILKRNTIYFYWGRPLQDRINGNPNQDIFIYFFTGEKYVQCCNVEMPDYTIVSGILSA